MPSKAYSYIRFSSPEQAKGDSYRRQRALAESYCQTNGLELAAAKEYTFLDKGKSAFSGRHLDDEGQLRRFLDLVENGTIERGSYLLVESLDRLSREAVITALGAFLALLNKGIRIVTLSDNQTYTDESSDMQIIISIMHMSRAHSESSIKGQRVSAAWEQKKSLARSERKPLGKACPYWLELVEGQYQPIQTRVKTILLIFDLAIQGYGQGMISRMLNERGIPVFGSRNRNHAGAWGNSSVSKLLCNRALLGEYQPTHIVDGKRVDDGQPVINFFPIVIDEMTFYQAQAVRAERRVSKPGRQSKQFNVFQGVTKCSKCGDAMHLVNKGRPPKGHTYLQCHSARKGVCDNGYVRLERAEYVFKEVLAKIDSLSLVQTSAGQTTKELSVIRGKLQTVSDRLTASVRLLTETPSSALATLVQNLEREQTELSANEHQLKETLAVNQIVSKADFFDQLDLISFEGRHAANSLLKRLGVLIHMRSSASDLQGYRVSVEGALQFELCHFRTAVGIYTTNAGMLDLQMLQGEISEEYREQIRSLTARVSDGSLTGVADRLKSIDLSRTKIKITTSAEQLLNLKRTTSDS